MLQLAVTPAVGPGRTRRYFASREGTRENLLANLDRHQRNLSEHENQYQVKKQGLEERIARVQAQIDLLDE